uniref:Uncharacterized protein n=1 Tax=viral metagenome TaxID=1070528 RepID=A0A6M3XMM5_9ZZZZ
MEPKQALETMCYISSRTWDGTVYTISDIRFPEYNGKQVLVSLINGKNTATWMDCREQDLAQVKANWNALGIAY